jgi:hypothetical protein
MHVFGPIAAIEEGYERMTYDAICRMTNEERETKRQQWKDKHMSTENSIRTYKAFRRYDRECRQQAIRERKVCENI